MVTILHLRDLPTNAREAIGAMADPGEPFQGTDTLSEAIQLPLRRFRMATGIGCRLHLNYERGSRAYGVESMELTRVHGSWRQVVSHSRDRRMP